ncbi:AMP-binding protein [Lichenifustis flavocetrariae]|uniref:AMP-binding protein n=1 Tax=Lichenifustis flavocetrariae TaxID=2949735 RepID=A0AA42CHN1_9HYPH|nr:AMP-binding protein [Lichenifustis flavocetrariae]MCW6507429.1 AMP-binding protein [Lichenifustis flavocetrariae]
MEVSESSDPSQMRAAFRWRIPERYNIGVDVCDRWAERDPGRAAIIDVADDGHRTITTYAELRAQSNQLARALRGLGVVRSDRVAVLLPQCAEAVSAHVAIYKLGAIAVPLASVFGVDALAYRLADSGTKLVLTNGQGAAKIAAIGPLARSVEIVISIDGADGYALGYAELLARQSQDFQPTRTSAEDPALMIYTSGTTGQPKGALHAHRVLPGHLPGIQISHDFLPQPGDLMWTPADWAWAGGLLNALLPSLHFGVPVVARRVERFDPEAAFALMARQGIRNAFIPPTALRLLRTVARPRERFSLALRSVTSAGEPLGAETFLWGQEAFGLAINEVFGQTECNYVLASCGRLGLSRPGAIGQAVPGHHVGVIRPDGSLCDPGETGQIAVAQPDPAMFLRYWNQPEATAQKYLGLWMTTGDLAWMDADGYVTFLGRNDDIITSSGYRIGPAEIEDCLLKHPAVVSAAAVGKPDPIRTEIVKTFVVLRAGTDATPALATEIKDFVRSRLSAHEYPREVAFVDALPMTSSGKIMRRLLREQA